ncbi:hypothetical protein [Kitasatospora indigofera]|uniref:hypothetical protein n=1 Tax=Kitasatospora indigofera TaxID=67307 RepID=UPI0036C352E8
MNLTSAVPLRPGPDAGPGPRPAAASAAALTLAASAAGLRVLSSAQWPESAEDRAAPAIAGFVVSSFSPLAAEAARRCLQRGPASDPGPGPASDPGPGPAPDPGPGPASDPVPAPAPAPGRPEYAGRPVTAVVMVSPLGDLAGAAHVAEAVDDGARIGPLLFFQAVPNAVAGHVAARWQLTGPVVCVADTATAMTVSALLLADGDAEEALLIRVDQAHTPDGPDRAAAVLLGPGPLPAPEPQLHEGEQP